MEKRREVIIFPLITEKAVDAIEKENKITFVVENDATKKEVREEIEKRFKVKVDKVNTVNDMKGRKRAIVRINSKFKANDIAMKLGVI